MKVREKIAAGVRCRLEAVAAHREAVRSGLAFFALPQNAAAGLASLYRTVDAIWYAAGDRATDYNFYTKRALLAGVYRSEEHTSELQSLMRISYAVFCLKKKTSIQTYKHKLNP